jgi:hypothetical protein
MGYRGLLQCDAYAAYKQLGGRADGIGCDPLEDVPEIGFEGVPLSRAVEMKRSPWPEAIPVGRAKAVRRNRWELIGTGLAMPLTCWGFLRSDRNTAATKEMRGFEGNYEPPHRLSCCGSNMPPKWRKTAIVAVWRSNTPERV